ncbi:MAG: hypothetical protein RLY86_2136 [Pseudomonadota bacterium]|jgi:hypothetical protein
MSDTPTPDTAGPDTPGPDTPRPDTPPPDDKAAGADAPAPAAAAPVAGPAADKHPLADAARTLYAELQAAGKPVVGVGIGDGRIYLRVTGRDHGAPEGFRGYPVQVLTDEAIKR